MNPATAISLGRIAVGIGSLARPDVAHRLLGSGNPMLTRWFGTREVALGAATLLADGSGTRTLTMIGIGVDAADAATAAIALKQGEVNRAFGAAVVAIALGAVVQGSRGLRVRRRTVIEAA